MEKLHLNDLNRAPDTLKSTVRKMAEFLPSQPTVEEEVLDGRQSKNETFSCLENQWPNPARIWTPLWKHIGFHI